MERASGQAGTSGRLSEAPRAVRMPRRDTLPLELLLAKEDPASLPRGTLVTKEQSKQARRDADWAGKREHVFAAVAAGFHLSVFAFNLAFWGFEGQAPDRYWPENPRIRLQLRPGRYGNLEGTQRVAMDYLARAEGVMEP